MSIARFTLGILLAGFVLFAGCITPEPNPLAGWHFEDRNPNQTIEKDYQDYIQKLPSDQKGFVGTVHFFADGAGQHAIRIEVFEKNRNAAWQHVIIYDKEDIRIRVVRCGYHRYQS